MSDISEGLGTAIEGALTGRAVEPKHGEASATSSEIEPKPCDNCGAMVSTAYCSECGQRRQVHRSLAALGHDLIHGVLHLDGKFWLTLPLLLFKPGKLTRRYIDGERAKFVSPMAMFLFSVFAMFAIFQMVGLNTPTTLGNQGALVSPVIEAANEEIASLEAQLDADDLDDEARDQLTQDLARAKTGLEALEEYRSGTAPVQTDGGSVFDTGNGGRVSVDSSLTGIEFIDDGLIKKWNENPGLMLYKLQANAYKFSWLLIPLSVPFVWLIFVWKRRFKAYDHAIFVTYSLSFMSLLFIAASILGVLGVPPQIIVFSVLLIPPTHLYKQLRGTYELSRFSAFWRLLVLSAFIWIVAGLFLQSLLILGAF